MSHYFTNNKELESKPKKYEVELLGKTFTFKTDIGVFSKDYIDFGSKLLINSLKINKDVKGNILEVGCGYGPIGISVASITDKTVHMIDVNERALQLAMYNSKNNNVDNVNIYKSDIYENVNDKFSTIISNPPIRAGKKVVHAILEGAYEHLNDNGMLWIVIQKKQGAESALKKLQSIYPTVTIENKSKGYYIISARKY